MPGLAIPPGAPVAPRGWTGRPPGPVRWRAALAALLLATPLPAVAQSVTVPLILRDGLFYVPVRLLGCVQQPDLELLLDTGAATTVLPYHHLQRMCSRFTAIRLEDVRVEHVHGAVTEAGHYLLDGLRIGPCELPAVRAIAAVSTSGGWRPVLGLDVLGRLQGLRIELRPDGGELAFTCPDRPAHPADECLVR